MKKYIKSNVDFENIIHITLYLEPIFYEHSEIFGRVKYDPKQHKFNTDINPSRILNGPLSGPGEELSPPISYEWDLFIDDCRSAITGTGFVIISEYRSQDSKKSEYTVFYGMDDDPCGEIVFDLRISDHVLEDLNFPPELKQKTLECLKVNNVLDGAATEAGIDFQVKQVLVGQVKDDTWNRALNRLYQLLKRMRT